MFRATLCANRYRKIHTCSTKKKNYHLPIKKLKTNYKNNTIENRLPYFENNFTRAVAFNIKGFDRFTQWKCETNYFLLFRFNFEPLCFLNINARSQSTCIFMPVTWAIMHQCYLSLAFSHDFVCVLNINVDSITSNSTVTIATIKTLIA